MKRTLKMIGTTLCTLSLLAACSDEGAATSGDSSVDALQAGKEAGSDAVNKDQGNPVADKGKPAPDQVADQAKPVADKANPVVDKANPVVDKANPVADKGSPVADKGSPVSDKGSPASDGVLPCTAMDAHTKGICGSVVGIKWDGSKCVAVSCACTGADCSKLFSTIAACQAAYAHCLPSPPPSCKAMDVKGVGLCEKLLGFHWDGKLCKSLAGCSCAGTDCPKLFTSQALCSAAYKGCAP